VSAAPSDAAQDSLRPRRDEEHLSEGRPAFSPTESSTASVWRAITPQGGTPATRALFMRHRHSPPGPAVAHGDAMWMPCPTASMMRAFDGALPASPWMGDERRHNNQCDHWEMMTGTDRWWGRRVRFVSDGTIPTAPPGVSTLAGVVPDASTARKPAKRGSEFGSRRLERWHDGLGNGCGAGSTGTRRGCG
jgi:hypothetical protein